MVQNIGSVGSGAGVGSSQFTQARRDAFDAVAGELGMSPSDLRTAMQGGQSLTQIASSKGVSSQDLQKTITDSLKQDLPNASDAQLAQAAEKMVSGHHHHHHAHPAQASAPASAADPAANVSDTGIGVSVIA